MVIIEDNSSFIIQDPEYYEILEEEIEDEIKDNPVCARLLYHVKQELLSTLDIVHVVQSDEHLDYKEYGFLYKTTSRRQKRATCNICFKSFCNKSTMIRHIKIHTGEQFEFTEQSNVHGTPDKNEGTIENKHLSDYEEQKPKELSDFNLVENNVIVQNCKTTTVSKRKFECEICGRTFGKRYRLLDHRHTHTGEPVSHQFHCSVCEKQFRDKRDFDDHIRTHTGDKPFSCEICDRSFAQSSNLRRHQRVHTGEPAIHKGQVIQCDICGRSFGQHHQLIRHMKVHFPLTNTPKYKCDQCPKKFTEKHHLVRHVRAHTGEKPYKCDYCDMKFTFHASYTKHRRIHTNEKPFTCNLCEKSFTQLTTLNYHMHVHSGEPRYICLICDKTFSRHRDYKVHKQVHKAC